MNKLWKLFCLAMIFMNAQSMDCIRPIWDFTVWRKDWSLFFAK